MSKKGMNPEVFDTVVLSIDQKFRERGFVPKLHGAIPPHVAVRLESFLTENFSGVGEGICRTAPIMDDDQVVVIMRQELDAVVLECAIVLAHAGITKVYFTENLAALRLWVIEIIREKFECSNLAQLEQSRPLFSYHQKWRELAEMCGSSAESIQEFVDYEKSHFPNGYE
jgi:hypothetical protein